MTDPNNAQSQRHGVIKRTIAGSLARSWPPPLCRRRCCVLLLRTAVEPACCCCSEKSLCSCVVSVVCRVFRLSFTFVSYARVRQCTPPRHGVVKRTIRGSLARSWPPPPRCRAAAAAACCCYYCWAWLLLLPIIVMLFLLLLCASFVYSVCGCSRTNGTSSLELGKRHASCDILLSLLLQLRLLRLLRVLPRTVAVAAVGCHGIFEDRSPGGGKQSRQNKRGQTVECSLLDL